MIMKNTALLFVCVSLAFSAYAQNKTTVTASKPTSINPVISDSPTAKGKWLVGPALSTSSYNDEDGTDEFKLNRFDFQPEIGYFIVDDLSVGLSLRISMSENKLNGVTVDKGSGLGAAPTLRYYLNLAPKFKLIGKFQVPIGSIKQTLSNGNPVDDKKSFWEAKLSPVFAFFPSDKVSIELDWGSLYFHSEKNSVEKETKLDLSFLNGITFQGSISSPTLGVKWHLGK